MTIRTVAGHALDQYMQHFLAGTKPATPIQGIHVRFVRMPPGWAPCLTDDPERRIILSCDEKTAHDMLGVSGWQMAMSVGWDADYARGKINAGYTFGVVVYPAATAKVADWDNMLDAVALAYPEVAAKIARWRGQLRQMTPQSFKQMVAGLGYNPQDVNKSDPRFMSIAAYKAAPDTLESARLFLYHTAGHLKELYAGDGRTRNAQGQVGPEELIVAAVPLSQFGEYRFMPVTMREPKVHAVLRASGKGELPMPGFFRPESAAEWTHVPVLQRQAAGAALGLADEAEGWRKAHGIKPAAQDARHTELLLIDLQKDFCNPAGTLYVGGRSGTGAIDDCARTAAFVHRNLHELTGISGTLDTHFAHQIFFPAFWRDENGHMPAPHTVITTDDIRAGKFVPNPAMARWLCGGNYAWLLKQVLHYTEALEKAGKYQLYLWPPHCILGTEGHALAGVVAEAVMFHAYVRSANPHFEVKGGHPLTENYSVMAPEVLSRHDGQPLMQRSAAFVHSLLKADRLVIAGQAASHCVAASIADLLDEIVKIDATLARKVYLLSDCMSAVVVPGGKDFTPEAEAALGRFRAAGMHVVTSDVPMADWT